MSLARSESGRGNFAGAEVRNVAGSVSDAATDG